MIVEWDEQRRTRRGLGTWTGREAGRDGEDGLLGFTKY